MITEPPAATSIWHYLGSLPELPARRLTLGEAGTPLFRSRELEEAVDESLEIWIKDESATTVGTFKARGMALAVSARAAAPPPAFVVASPGNAGIAAATYAGLVDRPCVVLAAGDTPPARLAALTAAGATVFRVDGGSETAAQVAEGCVSGLGWGDLTTSAQRDPWHHVGTETIGREIAAALPDDGIETTVFACAGGGNLVAGLHDGFRALRLQPTLVAAQASGCAPIARALQVGAEEPLPWERARTTARSIADPIPLDGSAAIAAVRASGGRGYDCDDARLLAEADLLREATGIDADESVGAALAALRDSAGQLAGGRAVLVLGARRIRDVGQPPAPIPLVSRAEELADLLPGSAR